MSLTLHGLGQLLTDVYGGCWEEMGTGKLLPTVCSLKQESGPAQLGRFRQSFHSNNGKRPRPDSNISLTKGTTYSYHICLTLLVGLLLVPKHRL